jgi:hypothetical protein
VEAADQVDLDDGLERVARKLAERCQEIPRGARSARPSVSGPLAQRAPSSSQHGKASGGTEGGDVHDEIKPAQLVHAPRHRPLQVLEAAHVDAPDAQHAGPGPKGSHLLRGGLGARHVAADDAGVGAEAHEGADLHAADAAGPAGAENDLAVWSRPLALALVGGRRVCARSREGGGGGARTEDAGPPHGRHVCVWRLCHGGGMLARRRVRCIMERQARESCTSWWLEPTLLRAEAQTFLLTGAGAGHETDKKKRLNACFPNNNLETEVAGSYG